MRIAVWNAEVKVEFPAPGKQWVFLFVQLCRGGRVLFKFYLNTEIFPCLEIALVDNPQAYSTGIGAAQVPPKKSVLGSKTEGKRGWGVLTDQFFV
jgi:hypothetical protein